jgi:L-lactate utilization protein LutB
MDYTQIATKESVEKTISALKERGHLPEFVETRSEALERIKELIPAGASVMNGTSRTLEEIGLVDYLKSGTHGWNNLHEAILAETDKAKQGALRKQSVLSDFYLGSAHAVAETGEIIIASNSGSQLPHIIYTSPNLILVVGAQKIAPNLDGAMRRLQEHVIPLEDERMKSTGAPGTYPSKILIINKEQSFMGRKSYIIFVNERLGF